MSAPPKVFISATSGDLRSVRQLVKEALLTINCHPVEQTNFEPDWRTVEGMLRGKIEGCQALIHIAGMRYGAEPKPESLPPETPRRSYTQMEYHIGRALHQERGDGGFRVYTFLCPEDFPYDIPRDGAGQPMPPEEETKAALQRQHRQDLLASPSLRESPRTADELRVRILALQEQVLSLQQEQAEVKTEVIRARRFGWKALAAVVLLLGLVLAGNFLLQHQVKGIAAGQTVTTGRIRAHLLEASEKQLALDLDTAEKEAKSSERQKLKEAAQAAHQARVARMDELAESFREIEGSADVTQDMREMARILAEEGVEPALRFADGLRQKLLEIDAASSQAHDEKARKRLQPLLKAAQLLESSGQAEEARKRYRQLLDRQPNWPEVLGACAWFFWDQSVQAESIRGPSAALADAQESHRLAQRLLAKKPAHPPSQRLTAATLNQLGALAVAQGDLAGALLSYTESKTIFERLTASDPANAEWQRDLSVSLNQLGALAVAQGDLAGALRSFTESRAIREHLAASDPANAQCQRDLAVSIANLGDLAVAQGDLTGALRHHTECKVIFERLAASDPANAAWRFDLGISNERLGDLAVQQGKLDEALLFHTKRQDIIEGFAKSDPNNAAWQRDLSVSLNKLGDLAVARGDLARALRYYTESKTIREGLAASDPANAEWQRDLAASYSRLADHCEKSKKAGEAKSWWRKEHDIMARMKERGMHLTPKDEGLLKELRAKLGE